MNQFSPILSLHVEILYLVQWIVRMSDIQAVIKEEVTISKMVLEYLRNQQSKP